jgi:hypothetical protein
MGVRPLAWHQRRWGGKTAARYCAPR